MFSIGFQVVHQGQVCANPGLSPTTTQPPCLATMQAICYVQSTSGRWRFHLEQQLNAVFSIMQNDEDEPGAWGTGAVRKGRGQYFLSRRH